MRSTITISLPEKMRKELDKTSEKTGIPRSAVIQQSLRDYFFLRKFRSLRKSMMTKASAQGIFTDEDVFDQIS